MKTGVAFTLAIVFACFTMASTSYLAWLYRLMEFVPAASVNPIALVGGYAFQAVSIGLGCAGMKANIRFARRAPFAAAIAIHFACAAAAMLASEPVSLVVLG